MRAQIAFMCLIVITGCSSGGLKSQLAVKPVAIHNPYVLVIGDRLVTSWGTPAIMAANPMWTFAGSTEANPQEISGSVEMRTPGDLLLANPADPGHPDVVVFLVGTFDMEDTTWQGPCDAENTSALATIQTCTNVEAMIGLAKAAGSFVIVCTLPITAAGNETDSLGNQLLTANPSLSGNELIYNRNLGIVQGQPGWKEDKIVDLAGAVAGTDWTDDGATPNDAGAELFTSLIQAAITKIGGAR